MSCRCGLAILFVALISACSAAAADVAKKEISNEKYRLPKSIRPDYYKLNVLTHINDDEGFKFIGDVSIKAS